MHGVDVLEMVRAGLAAEPNDAARAASHIATAIRPVATLLASLATALIRHLADPDTATCVDVVVAAAGTMSRVSVDWHGAVSIHTKLGEPGASLLVILGARPSDQDVVDAGHHLAAVKHLYNDAEEASAFQDVVVWRVYGLVLSSTLEQDTNRRCPHALG